MDMRIAGRNELPARLLGLYRVLDMVEVSNAHAVL
jgi:hypothetical protein